MRPNTTPGDILKEEFMKPYQLNMSKLATMIGVPTNRISNIVNAKRSITADTAIRLSMCFKNSPQFWMNLQRDYDLAEALENLKDLEVEPIG